MSKIYLGEDDNRQFYECKLYNNNKNLEYIYYKAEFIPLDNKEDVIFFNVTKNKITKSEFLNYSKKFRLQGLFFSQ